jgi:hypothetical protein
MQESIDTTNFKFKIKNWTMLPTFPSFSRLSLKHQEDIDRAISKFPPYCDYTFASIYPWDSLNQIELSSLSGNLIVKFTDYVTDEPFLSFLGTNRIVETIDNLFEYAQNSPNLLKTLKLIPEGNLQGTALPHRFQVAEDPDNFDYVYAVEDLVNLRGEKYRQKRNEINNFNKKYSARVAQLDPKSDETWPQIESVLNLWSNRQLAKGNDAKNDVLAVKRTLEIASLIKLLIFGFFVAGKLRGYTFVELNEGGYSTDLFEHADVSFDGIFPFQRHQVALDLRRLGYKFLNNQQDLGLAGLKHSKKLWHPAFYLKKYIIRQI